MAEIAEAMTNGELCVYCGVYLEPCEEVYIQATMDLTVMPDDGSPAGVPVMCLDCSND
jgi:hypothetical protein